MEIVPKQNLTLKDQAYRWIRDRIVEGKLPLGAVLSPRRLGREMGMSFLPISDALQRLEAEGLTECKDRVGTRVRIPTAEDIKGVYEIRVALESQAARLCCERATKEQRRELKRLARQVDARYAECRRPHATTVMITETNALHVSLHRLIAVSSQCPRLEQEIERSQVLLFKNQFDNLIRVKKRPLHWHRSLVNSILNDDVLVADQAARFHIRYSIGELLDAVAAVQVEERWRA